jgi:hypothetical protein
MSRFYSYLDDSAGAGPLCACGVPLLPTEPATCEECQALEETEGPR